MKICLLCHNENTNDTLYCEVCGSPLSDVKITAGDPTPRKKKNPKPRKPPEYVQLYHGPMVKKSTAKYLARKDNERFQWYLGFLIVAIICGLISQCGN